MLEHHCENFSLLVNSRTGRNVLVTIYHKFNLSYNF